MPTFDRSDLTPDAVLNGAIAVLGGAMAVWLLLYANGTVDFPRARHANLILGLGVAVYYLHCAIETYRGEHDDSLLPRRPKFAYLLGLAIVILATTAFVHVEFWRWVEEGRVQQYTTVDLIVGGLIMFVVTEATFREYGRTLGSVVVAAVLYGLFGSYLPGVLSHSGLTVDRLIARETIVLDGVYGTLLTIGATWIAIFVLMAGVIDDHGGFDYLLKLASKAAARSRSGIAQSSVLASMFIGSMMGGAAANVATTGSFTIPMMIENGLPKRFAAAAESMASTGGQILPPIMSLAAFLMVDFTGVSYATIAVAGVIPAILFFATVSTSIHLYVLKNDLVVEDVDDLPSFDSRRAMWLQTVQYIVPLLVLIYFLMILQYPPMLVGLYTIVGFLAIRGLVKLLQVDVKTFVLDTFRGFRTGAVMLAPYMAILASLGIVIDIVGYSGLANKIAIWVVLYAGDAFLLVLLLCMVVSLLFGLGMPTPAAYIVVALVLAPALTQVGLETLSAHFYVFYFAVFSAITPPVAVGVAVACGIADSGFVETTKETLKLGGPVFLIPFLFVSNPEILTWEFPATPIKAAVFLVAILALVSLLIGYNGRRTISLPERGLAVALFAVMAFAPTMVFQIAGAVAFLALFARDYYAAALRSFVRESGGLS